MKRKYLIFTILIIGLLFIMCKSSVYAASAGITASSTNVNVGDNVSIKVNVTAATWDVKVNGSGIVDSITGGNANLTEETNEKSYKLDTSKPGTYTVSISGSITSSEGQTSKPSQSVTITVKEPVKEEPKQDPPKNTTPTNQTLTNQTPTNTTPANTTPANKTPTNTTPIAQPQTTYQAVNDTVYSTSGTINIRSGPSTSYSVVGSLAKGEPLTRTGIGSDGWDKVMVNGSVAYINHALITTVKPEEEPKVEEKSTNKSLKELKVEGYDLTPVFDPQNTKYTINLNEDETEDSLELTATAEDEKATVNVEGNENFTPGNNIVKITVTAEDETTRIYTITVVKSNKIITDDKLKLSTLEISNATLEPAFSPDITNYIIHIEDPSVIKAQNFVATPADKDVTVTNAENTLSEDGEKVIVFMLQSKDGSKNGTYQITVKKPAAKVESLVKKDNDKTIYYILGGTIAVLIILIIIIIVALKKTADSDDDEDYEDEDEEYSNNNSTSKYNLNSTNNFDYLLKNAIDEVNSDVDEHSTEVDNFKFTSQSLNKKMKNFDMNEDVNDQQKSSIDKTRAFKFNPNNSEDNNNIDYTEKKKGKHF